MFFRYTQSGINALTIIIVLIILSIIFLFENINIPKYKIQEKEIYNQISNDEFNQYKSSAKFYNNYMGFIDKITDIKPNIPKIIIPKIGLSLDIVKKETNEGQYAELKNNMWFETKNVQYELLVEGDTILYIDNNQTYIYKIEYIISFAEIHYTEGTGNNMLIITQENEDGDVTYIKAFK